MFDTWSYNSILFLIIFVTVILSVCEFFSTKSMTQFYDSIGFFSSIKYRIYALLIIVFGGIIIKYFVKQRAIKKKNKEASVFKEMFGGFYKFLNTIIP